MLRGKEPSLSIYSMSKLLFIDFNAHWIAIIDILENHNEMRFTWLQNSVMLRS